MSEQNDVDAQLAEVLARIYRDKANSERIARQADIDVTRITLSDTAIVTWSSIILQAKLQSRVNRLFDIVTQEYPDYLDLTGVIAEFKRVNRSPSTTLTQATAPDIPVGREQPSSDQIQGWLDLHGFTQNPFIQSEANREKSLLPEYFIKTPVFEENLAIDSNIQSTVIAAGRGCGKTAHRIMMARDCQPHNTASSMLAVEYTTFSQFGERVAQGLPSPGVRDHLTLLLNIIIEDWIRVLLKSSDLASRMPVHNLGRLKWFWLTYGTSFNQPSIYYAGMIGQLLDSHAYTIDWIKFANAWKTGRLSSLLKHTPIWMYPQVRLVGLLVDATVEPLQVERLPADALFQQLFDLVQASGLTSVCIVVDRTDESHMLATSPERVAEMLTPLLHELPLMELPCVAFKFFVPLEVAHLLARHPGIRLDRILFRELKWDDRLLNDLLVQRLGVFSNWRVTDMGQLCEDGALAATIQPNLIASARGIPRNLLRVAHQLIIEHCILNRDKVHIQPLDWSAANQAPELRDIFVNDRTSVSESITYTAVPEVLQVANEQAPQED